MPPFIVHETEVPEDEGRYPPPFDAEALTWGRDLGRAAGSRNVGAWVERIPAGRRTSRTHAHLHEEEMVYVLAGSPVVRWIPPGGEAQETTLRPGHFVSFPAGTGVAHHLWNPGPDEAKLLVFGERRADDRIAYPEDPAFEAWREEHRPDRRWPDLVEPHPDAKAPAWRIRTARVELRPWQVRDANSLHRLVIRNRARLGRWMGWANDESTLDQVAARILNFHHAFATREDLVYAVFRDGQAIGGTGLHSRVGPAAFEIGYWIDGGHEGHGLVTEWVAALTRTAFLVHKVDRVEIRMDPRNERSSSVPRRLGFTLEATLPRRVPSPDGLADAMVWTLYRSEAGRLGTDSLEAWDVLDRRLI